MFDNVRIPWDGWRIVDKLGKGSYGTVYEIERTLGSFVEKSAMKVISIPSDNQFIEDYHSEGFDDKSISNICESYLNDTILEYELMKSLGGKANIVSCEDIAYLAKTDSIGWDVYIRMELLTPFLKHPKTKELTETDILKLGKDLCQALIHCEDKNIIHRDIKPGNIFIDEDGTYKLGDFGVARILDHATNATRVGTERFMAPEVIKQDKYDKDVDLYSLGLLLYWLLNERRMPFLKAGIVPTAQEVADAYQKRISGHDFDAPQNGTPALKQVVLKACAFEPRDRYQSAREMLKALTDAEMTLSEIDKNVSMPIQPPHPLDNEEGETQGNQWYLSGETIPKPYDDDKKESSSKTSETENESKTIGPGWEEKVKESDKSYPKHFEETDSSAHIVYDVEPSKGELPQANSGHFVRNFIISIALVLCFLAGLSSILIQHDASNDEIDSFDTMTLGNIDWVILAQGNGKALLLTKDLLEYKPYNEEYDLVTWETCTLRSYLNGTWYNNTFSEEEKAMIQTTNVTNPDNSEYETFGGNATEDKVFLLSIDEVEQYFPSWEARILRRYNGKTIEWWLRSPGYDSGSATYVASRGYSDDYGTSVNSDDIAVRPALWINLES